MSYGGIKSCNSETQTIVRKGCFKENKIKRILLIIKCEEVNKYS